MAVTTILEATKIEVAQASKEVTANEAFDIFDAAFGEKTIAMSDANYTLSTVTQPKEFVWGVLKFTGTLTALRNIVVPLNKKPYTIVNATTGGFGLLVKTASGSGVTVGNGDTVDVRCDGTNVIAKGAASAGYDIAAQSAGAPGASAVLLFYQAVRSFTFPAAFTGSKGKASVAATAQTDFDIQKNGSSIGTMRFAAAGTVPSFLGAGGSFAAGDELSVVAPGSPDATLATIRFTLLGTRS